jgi:hypothetical protein
MWRSVLLAVVLAGVVAGCNRDGPSGGLIGVSTPSHVNAGPRLPYTSVVVRGTRTFNSGELGVPLTVQCPQSVATGFKQVIRTPWKPGNVTIFGGSPSGGGMTFAVGQSGAVTITC